MESMTDERIREGAQGDIQYYTYIASESECREKRGEG